MFRASLLSAILLSSIALVGCAKSQTANPNAACEACGQAQASSMMGGSGMMGMMMGPEQCPMTVPGTTVQSTNTSDGMAMTFTTSGDKSELRKRVHAMAERMDSSSGAGPHRMMGAGSTNMMGANDANEMMGGRDGGAMMMGGGGSMMGGAMPMRADAEDVEGGARLRMKPANPSQLEPMREHMQQHAQAMNQAHACPMIGAR